MNDQDLPQVLAEPAPKVGRDGSASKGSIGETQGNNALAHFLESKGDSPVDMTTDKRAVASGTDIAMVTQEGDVWAGDVKNHAKLYASTIDADKPVGPQARAAGVPAHTTKADDYLAQAHNAVAGTDQPEPALHSHLRAKTSGEPFYDPLAEHDPWNTVESEASSDSPWEAMAGEMGAELSARKEAGKDRFVVMTTGAPLSEGGAKQMSEKGFDYVHVVDEASGERSGFLQSYLSKSASAEKALSEPLIPYRKTSLTGDE